MPESSYVSTIYSISGRLAKAAEAPSHTQRKCPSLSAKADRNYLTNYLDHEEGDGALRDELNKLFEK